MHDQLTFIQTALTERRRRALLPEPSQRRALRKRVGLSQSAVAGAIGVSAAMVSGYEASPSEGLEKPPGNGRLFIVQSLRLRSHPQEM